MTSKKQILQLFFNWISVGGIIFFVALYFFAASLYPGGSQADATAHGFDWIHNYWCNLLSEEAINGVLNPARPFAIIAMVILCVSIVIFFYQFAEFFVENNIWKNIIKWSGGLSMFFAVLIFTEYHDAMTLISSLFGLLVVLGIIKEIYDSDLSFYKITGTISLLLLAINNMIYYSGHLIEWLPLIQKITFLVVLLWVLGLNREIRNKILKR